MSARLSIKGADLSVVFLGAHEQIAYLLLATTSRESHRCQMAGNTVWSHMACDFS